MIYYKIKLKDGKFLNNDKKKSKEGDFLTMERVTEIISHYKIHILNATNENVYISDYYARNAKKMLDGLEIVKFTFSSENVKDNEQQIVDLVSDKKAYMDNFIENISPEIGRYRINYMYITKLKSYAEPSVKPEDQPVGFFYIKNNEDYKEFIKIFKECGYNSRSFRKTQQLIWIFDEMILATIKLSCSLKYIDLTDFFQNVNEFNDKIKQLENVV